VENGQIDVSFSIKEGEKFYVDKIEIQGNTTTKDKVIRREIDLAPGEVFDTVREKAEADGRVRALEAEVAEARGKLREVAAEKRGLLGMHETSQKEAASLRDEKGRLDARLAEVLEMLNEERANLRRIVVLERLHQRYNSLRVTRERMELFKEATTKWKRN
jgi:chromosome segregation ATPase